MLPILSIITPSYNQAQFLEQTIDSVLSQNYPDLEYIIIDGGSTDGSIEIIKKYEKYLTYWVSEKDKGQYDALQKGFNKATGEIMAWLNSDDLYHKDAFRQVATVFNEFPNVNWIEGINTTYAHNSICRNVEKPAMRSPLIYYLKGYHNFIQQESTFWRRSLWEKAGSIVGNGFGLAGDFELWMRFFKFDTVYQAPFLIGGFRTLPDAQRSSLFKDEYLLEVKNILDDHKSNYINSLRKIVFRRKLLRVLSSTRILNIFFLKDRIEKNIYSIVNPPSQIHFDYIEDRFDFCERFDYEYLHLLSNSYYEL